MVGGDIGPELTNVGSKVNPDWLVAWLRDPQAYLGNSQMPRDHSARAEELADVAREWLSAIKSSGEIYLDMRT